MSAPPRRPYNVELLDGNPRNTDDPQGTAFTALFERAREVIKIETPNLNAAHAKDLILEAVDRGVEARVILPIGFNAGTMRKKIGPIQMEGANVDAIAELYERLDSADQCELLQIRWNSANGRDVTWANVIPGGNHTKYMTVDGKMAFVGSANPGQCVVVSHSREQHPDRQPGSDGSL